MGRIHYEATRVCVLYAYIQYGISWPSMFVIRIYEGLIWSGKVACIQMEWMNDGFSLIWWKFVWLGKYLSISFWLERISIDKTVRMWVARTNKPEHYLASTPNGAIPFGEKCFAEVNHQLSMSSRKTFMAAESFLQSCEILSQRNRTNGCVLTCVCDVGIAIDWVIFSVLFTLRLLL